MAGRKTHGRGASSPRWRLWGCVMIFASLLMGCDMDMARQPRFDPFEASDFFPDRRSARQPVPGTVARGQLRADEHLYRGKTNGKTATTFPFPVTRKVMERGRERYDIYCAVCHDHVGMGRGMAVQRGFPPPPSLHTPRLRAAQPGYFFDVITNGFGVMRSYKAQIAPQDRWAITAYMRALQLSQNAKLGDLSAEEYRKLMGSKR